MIADYKVEDEKTNWEARSSQLNLSQESINSLETFQEENKKHEDVNLSELCEIMDAAMVVEKSEKSEEEKEEEGQIKGSQKNTANLNTQILENLNIEIEYVEASFNYQGNYHNYVSRVLKSIVPLRFLNYTQILEENKIILPEAQEQKKTLILDLDETLIHADFDSNFSHYDHIVTFHYEGQDVSVPILIRPGLSQFLHNASEIFEIFIFTASKKEYADAVLNYLDPENKIFKMRFYRENCINIRNRIFLKDLRIFANRKPEDLLIVDNSLYSFTNQLSNGILINSFYNDREDRELFNLFNYLEQYICNADDLRTINEKIFNFSSILEEFSDLHFFNQDIRN